MDNSLWPPLPLAEWKPTYDAIHLWSQVLGKVCLARTPLVNHYWNATLHVSPRGLVTPLLFGDSCFTMELDFLEHRLEIRCSSGDIRRLPLEPCTLASFHSTCERALSELGLETKIDPMPQEIADAVPFDLDLVPRPYDPEAADRFRRVLLRITPTFQLFRSRFIGKCSPVHFFWGSFDLACTRFSGRRAPPRPGANAMTRESYSHEVISHGFWPGGGGVQEPAFYAYAAPEPVGLRDATVEPTEASYRSDMSEFILPYEVVRTAKDPESELMKFLASTYERASELGSWSRSELERHE